MSEQECWQAVAARSRAADGAFVYAVTTTGVYCRPSCASRRPLRQNVQFFPLPEAAEEEAPPEEGRLEGYTEFEPEPEKLLVGLAPRALEAEIFAALLEGAASFFTAQQRAMAAASENADDLVRTLTRVMNRARQDAITTEIMEIVGGAEALRQAKGA